MTLADKVALNNGISIPRLGLGVYQLGRGRATENAVSWALEVGYRHVDTAAMYGNEAEVGAALKRAFAAGLVPREEVFVTTKLWNSDHGYDEALRAFDASHRRLGLDQIDLFLLHWPVPHRRLHSWRALERVLAEGRCRAIGVSCLQPAHQGREARRLRFDRPSARGAAYPRAGPLAVVLAAGLRHDPEVG
jgi:diketogulonate reductase-like aldo/keto reductase